MMKLRNKIAQTLKLKRKSLGFSADYVVAELKKLGMNINSDKTLFGYENGVSQPKADMFLSLCKIYNIDNFDIFFDEEPAKKSNNYNLLNAFGKQKADEYIEDLAENPKYTRNNIEPDIISEKTSLNKSIYSASRTKYPEYREIAAYDVDDTPDTEQRPIIEENSAD